MQLLRHEVEFFFPWLNLEESTEELQYKKQLRAEAGNAELMPHVPYARNVNACQRRGAPITGLPTPRGIIGQCSL
jgi:hypothetical protein